MKNLMLFSLFTLLSFALPAQTLTSGDYSVTISKLASSIISSEMYGKIYSLDIIEGTYNIFKKGTLLIKQKFTYSKVNAEMSTLSIRNDERNGNSLTYDFKSKKFEFAYEYYKAKITNSTENIILSGILIYAKLLGEENSQ